jgi:hypothetical protein
MTVISNFSGNLGNHIMTYLLTRTVADKNGYDWGFNRKPEFDYLQGQSQLDMLFDLDYGKEHSFDYYTIPDGYAFWNEFAEDYGNRVFCPYQPDVFNIQDNTKLFIRCGQDARYYSKEKVKSWLSISDKIFTDKTVFDLPLWDKNFVVINVRGGEYKGLPELCLGKDYYLSAIAKMQERVENCKFVVITDDMNYARSILPFPVYHFSIALDYWIIQNASNLILSNSSFAIIPAWINVSQNIIAPRYWARYNISTGYWTSSDIWTFGFKFLDKNGELYDN